MKHRLQEAIEENDKKQNHLLRRHIHTLGEIQAATKKYRDKMFVWVDFYKAHSEDLSYSGPGFITKTDYKRYRISPINLSLSFESYFSHPGELVIIHENEFDFSLSICGLNLMDLLTKGTQ